MVAFTNSPYFLVYNYMLYCFNSIVLLCLFVFERTVSNELKNLCTLHAPQSKQMVWFSANDCAAAITDQLAEDEMSFFTVLGAEFM